MSFFLNIVISCGFLLATAVSAYAERDGVVVSIKPLHSLVSAVMEGVGEPSLIVQGAGSEHVYSLKPSDAEALQNAKVIFWAGPAMENFLAKSIETLGEGAQVYPLVETPNLKLLNLREGGPFEAHDHSENHEEPVNAHENSTHAHDSDRAVHHEHQEYDLHFWLDPENAKIVLYEIARVLSKSDPAHATQFADNAKNYAQRLDALTKDVTAELSPIRGKPFIVFHDAYQYFENRFGLTVAGSITVSPEKAPGAARIKEIREKVKALGATCVFAEPQFEPRIIDTIIEGTPAKVGILDPLGSELENGPNLYIELIRNLAESLTSCLKDQ